MKDLEKVKCSKCGFENIKGTVKCVKCHAFLSETKSCPKCAKRNNIDAVKCSKCGYRFNKSKTISLLFNLIISILLVIVLSLMIYFKHKGMVSNINAI